MKTMSVEIERTQTLTFFVKVPDHWTNNNVRAAMDDVIDDITNSDDFDWEFNDADFKAGSIYEIADTNQIDYEFPDEPAPEVAP